MSMKRDILVIEDEPMVLQAVLKVCEAEGMDVTAAESAPEALGLLRDHSFRLLLCDIMLPEMDGFQFLEALARERIETPVVMMTGYSTMENAVRSLSSGAIDYIAKPFTADELVTVIGRSLRGGALLRDAEQASVSPEREIKFVPCPANYHKLGYVSWARMEDEGTAKIGVSDLFLKAVDGVKSFEFSKPGEDLVQGTPCAVATALDGSMHGIMCPMSGSILECNGDADKNPSLVEKDPYFRGWLYRILPSSPESNLQWLSL